MSSVSWEAVSIAPLLAPLKMIPIPENLQVSALVVVSLLCFLALLYIANKAVTPLKEEKKAKTPAKKPSSKDEAAKVDDEPVAATPKRKTRAKTTDTGSVNTPGGRRSARLMNKKAD